MEISSIPPVEGPRGFNDVYGEFMKKYDAAVTALDNLMDHIHKTEKMDWLDAKVKWIDDIYCPGYSEADASKLETALKSLKKFIEDNHSGLPQGVADRFNTCYENFGKFNSHKGIMATVCSYLDPYGGAEGWKKEISKAYTAAEHLKALLDDVPMP